MCLLLAMCLCVRCGQSVVDVYVEDGVRWSVFLILAVHSCAWDVCGVAIRALRVVGC